MAEIFDAWIQSVLEEYWTTYQQVIEGYPAGFNVPSFETYVATRAKAVGARPGSPQPTPSQIDRFVADKMTELAATPPTPPTPSAPGIGESYTIEWLPNMPGYYVMVYADGTRSEPKLDQTYQPPETPVPTEPASKQYRDASGNLHQVTYTWRNGVWDEEDEIIEYAPKAKEALPGTSTPIPGGVKEGETVTLPNGSTGYWTRDNQGYPLWRELTTAPPTPPTYPQVGQDPYGGRGWWNPYTGEWQPPADWIDPAERARQAQARLEQEERGAWQQQQMAWWQQEAKMREDEERRQMTAQLAANPRSWLEYASYTGTTPTVQPWMLPLMPQQYGLKTGEPIPGYSPQGMGGMPGLTPASTQLWARMGPTAQQQLLGYGTARTGQTPEEQQWRMWSQAPPGGAFGGLQWQR